MSDQPRRIEKPKPPARHPGGMSLDDALAELVAAWARCSPRVGPMLEGAKVASDFEGLVTIAVANPASLDGLNKGKARERFSEGLSARTGRAITVHEFCRQG